MNMVTTIAYKNMKHYKSRNILTGIAIFLTTLLLFLVPTIGMDMVGAQFAMVNEVYPRWHCLIRDVDQETATKLAAHHDVSTSGLRADVGMWAGLDVDVSMMYMDENGLDLYLIELEEGRLPQKEQEIVVSRKLLKAAGLTGEIGDTIRFSYQPLSGDGLDYAKEGEFVICGFYREQQEEPTAYNSFVSREFAEKNIPADQIRYRFLFQVGAEENVTTDDVEDIIKGITEQFGIDEEQVRVNNEYLAANYVDPTTIPVIAVIMLIIVIAGIITIYSIYYVGMAERVREYGRMKAIGATNRQLRQIVFREGFCTALIAIPAGLLIGTLLVKAVLMLFLSSYSSDQSIMVATTRQLIKDGRIPLYHVSIYLLAAVVSLVTVYFSLRKPMKMAAKVSEIDAMRQQGGQTGRKKNKKARKSYGELNVAKVSRIYLTGNKKNTVVTVVSMGITGVLFMVIATVLSCANPVESANSDIKGQYELSNNVSFSNKEHPEYAWDQIVQNNALDEAMKQRLEAVDGVKKVLSVDLCYGTADVLEGDKIGICGIPGEWKEELMDGITEGSVTYEELQTGEKMIVHRNMLRWYPDIAIGDKLELSLFDGSGKTVTVEVAAFGDYAFGMSIFGDFMMAKEGLEKISNIGNHTAAYTIYTDHKQEPAVEAEIAAIKQEYAERLDVRSWQSEYERWRSAMAVTSGASYAFFAVLGLICIMNMINTMINNVHLRKKEIGMMQAIGMTDRQLTQLLMREGVFYIAGALILSICGGSLLGYPIFLWARNDGMFSISQYHYPFTSAAILILLLLAIKILLAWLLGRSVKKESLIERVRFSE